jgi:hypothetical protein
MPAAADRCGGAGSGACRCFACRHAVHAADVATSHIPDLKFATVQSLKPGSLVPSCLNPVAFNQTGCAKLTANVLCARRGVVLLHRWLDEFAGGGPSYAAGVRCRGEACCTASAACAASAPALHTGCCARRQPSLDSQNWLLPVKRPWCSAPPPLATARAAAPIRRPPPPRPSMRQWARCLSCLAGGSSHPSPDPAGDPGSIRATHPQLPLLPPGGLARWRASGGAR